MFDYETAAKILKSLSIRVTDKERALVQKAIFDNQQCKSLSKKIEILNATLAEREAEIQLLKNLLLEKEQHV